MQWFRHPNNFRSEPKLRAVEKILGEVATREQSSSLRLWPSKAVNREDLLPRSTSKPTPYRLARDRVANFCW